MDISCIDPPLLTRRALGPRLRYCGVGVFNKLDEATVAGFQAVADYITKPDPLVTLMMPREKRFYRAHLALPERKRRPCSKKAALAA